MKNRKILSLLLALVMVSSLFAGCGKNSETEDTADTVGTSEPITNRPDDPTESVPDSTVSEKNDTDSGLSQNTEKQGHRAWSYKFDENNFITISADYSTETDLVEHISFHMEIDNNYPDYKNMKAELNTYKILLDRENDPKTKPYSYTENPDGSAVFDCHFNDLCGEDRASRAALVLRFTGLEYNSIDERLFVFSQIDEKLKQNGFSVQ